LRISKEKLERHFDREDFDLSSFAWTVAEEYGIDSDRVVIKKVGERKTYAPLADPNLFFSFARLASRGRPSDISVLRWVSKYGLPKQKDEDSLLNLPHGKLNQASAPIDELVAEALEAHSGLNLHADLSIGDIESLRRRIRKLREDSERWKQLSKLDEKLVKDWGHEADGYRGSNLPWMAEVELAVFIRRKVESVRLDLAGSGYFDPSANGYNPTASWSCTDLFSAMYLQFYLLIVNDLPMRRCKNPPCKMAFPLTRKNKWFCDSTCRSNMRHYR
jgi:hypothetical protein